MNEKKTEILRGTLLCPLIVGNCALISSRGRLIRTSTVVAIHGQTCDEVRFETLNTHYRLRPNLAPAALAMSSVMCMAA